MLNNQAFWIVIALLITFSATIVNVILVVRLRDHRTDLLSRQSFAEGNSRIWEVNVLNPRNYDSRGKRLLGWLFLGIAVQLTSLTWLLVLLALADSHAQ